MENETIFSCKNVNLYYEDGKKHALKNINIDIYKNKV
ncbi:MAG TPA: phosphate ABC transporter ATP-binding protein, partial [Firmicutes bacterium]|nr:phosphate ABC transporter ATP-binding protein [Bacillota bacterium]